MDSETLWIQNSKYKLYKNRICKLETFVENAGVSSFLIQKSKFFSFCYPFSLDYFSTQLETIRKEHPTANHVVYAYRLRNLSGSLFEKFSDAGEPSGTAGKPTLHLLQMKNIINGALYTVRYFGGIKLGKGGLVRAYTDAAKLALDNALISEFILYQTIKITTIYSIYEKLEYELNNRKIVILDKTFSEQVKLVIRVRKEQIESIISYFSELGLQSYDIMD
jgi:uncharacterized YigZ family protein